MNDQDFKNKLDKLISTIDTLPEEKRGQLRDLAAETKARRERMQGTIKQLQDALDQLRLSVKYMAFDLEATRRENAYLRKLANGEEDQA